MRIESIISEVLNFELRNDPVARWNDEILVWRSRNIKEEER